MGESVTEISFTGFAPLIQIWAGICLLFFYEGLLKKSPLDSTLKQIENLYNDFVSRYQDIINQDKMPQSDYYLGTKWANLLATIKNLAALSFYYSILILAFIGLENNQAYSGMYRAFQFMNLFIIVYHIFSTLLVNLKIFHTYVTPTIFYVLLLVYFHHFETINKWFITNGWFDGVYFSVTSITVYTLFTCIIPLFLILIHILYDYYILCKSRRRFKKIGRNFDLMVRLSMHQIAMNELPKKLKKKLGKRILEKIMDGDNISEEATSKYVIDEINEQFDKFTTTRGQRIMRKVYPVLTEIGESMKKCLILFLKENSFIRF